MATHSLNRKTRARPPRLNGGRNRGAALIVGLIILAIMTILGLSAMRGTALEERMAGNLKESNEAFQAAEAALQAAISAIEANNKRPSTGGGQALAEACRVQDTDTACAANTNLGNWYSTEAADDPDGALFEEFADAPFVQASWNQPRVIVHYRFIPHEQGADPAGLYFYTVSAIATDPNGKASIVLQTTFPKGFP
ncbi:MAG TPA: PilX N-terminal domain-containing pilus assembly protein [Lamprocystis sp. (in: g-proteobacteria)]|nr:PilX N-terminal domain-containing pilus assembly protein [Lamprocystis sp. (in: g-proteobacteria)]